MTTTKLDHPLRLNQAEDLRLYGGTLPCWVYMWQRDHHATGEARWDRVTNDEGERMPHCHHPSDRDEARFYHGEHDWHIHGNRERDAEDDTVGF